jgi:ABC-type bacteriocin/lantibiotic exporter with double-glycine peptidase domain
VTLGVVLALALAGSPATAQPGLRLDVPLVRQSPERCGPAALIMVMRFHGADSAALAEAERAYDPVLRGTLITDLAAAARRARFGATVVQLPEDSLLALLGRGVAPILLYRRGVGPVSVGHYGVLVGWDPGRGRFILHDGGDRPRTVAREDLLHRWRAAGSLALLLSPPAP